ncbi:MAG: hypothetical protein AAGF25_02220, partial [Pseudomonadota bacterium]
EVTKAYAGIEIPDWVRSLAGSLCLLGILSFIIAVFYRSALWVGVPCLALGLIGILGADHLNNTERKVDWLLFNLAKLNNWAFEILPSTNRQKAEAMEQLLKQRNQNERRTPGELPMDPRLKRIHDRVGDLLRVKIGRVTQLEIDAFFRGGTKSGIPFWMAIGVTRSDMSLAVSSLKSDRYGNTGNQAYMFQMLCAYQLDRDTGIRARLLHESVTGESRRDFQTESVEFNRRFNLSIADRRGNAPSDAKTKEQVLLQALSPATQATLIDLKDKYDVQLVIDGDTIFYSGWDLLNTSDFEILGRHIAALVEAFAESAVSFKAYVE